MEDKDMSDLIDELKEEIDKDVGDKDPDEVAEDIFAETYSNIVEEFIGTHMLKATEDIDDLSMEKGDSVDIIEVEGRKTVIMVEGNSDEVEVDSKKIVDLAKEKKLVQF